MEQISRSGKALVMEYAHGSVEVPTIARVEHERTSDIFAYVERKRKEMKVRCVPQQARWPNAANYLVVILA